MNYLWNKGQNAVRQSGWATYCDLLLGNFIISLSYTCYNSSPVGFVQASTKIAKICTYKVIDMSWEVGQNQQIEKCFCSCLMKLIFNDHRLASEHRICIDWLGGGKVGMLYLAALCLMSFNFIYQQIKGPIASLLIIILQTHIKSFSGITLYTSETLIFCAFRVTRQ